MIAVGIVCLILMAITGVLCLVRIIRGPATLDRTVAADVFVSAMAGSIAIEAAVGRHTTTLPILVVLAFVGFLGSVSIARFAARDEMADDDGSYPGTEDNR
ncbi:monovalent cation/H+ antiporter complex subunit F [Aeromicrobium sp. CF3.5]|uniref:monovalent cation/H+ antiporter complex subunit F n=1 Tax=Aeromicrobium sp. CF3.5 TaxID=3373078 RepID=UPI003EE5051E